MTQHIERNIPPCIEDLRSEIDAIDDALLDLVERRMSVSASIAALKDAGGGRRLRLRPRREAEVVDRLTRRARVSNHEMIAHLWRTLMAYSLQGQAPTRLVLHTDGDRLAMHESVRARFGPAARISWADEADCALDAARDGEVVAILGTRMDGAAGEDLRVFDEIHCGTSTAYAIGRVAPEDVVPPEARR